MRAYLFKSFKKYLHIHASVNGRKILSSRLTEEEPEMAQMTNVRIGSFDNQGTPKPWTWAWTTDEHSFEIWRSSGLYLRLDSEGIKIFKPCLTLLKTPVAISIGKTGPISYGIIAENLDGSKASIGPVC